jgi:hypothetical protein
MLYHNFDPVCLSGNVGFGHVIKVKIATDDGLPFLGRIKTAMADMAGGLTEAACDPRGGVLEKAKSHALTTNTAIAIFTIIIRFEIDLIAIPR